MPTRPPKHRPFPKQQIQRAKDERRKDDPGVIIRNSARWTKVSRMVRRERPVCENPLNLHDEPRPAEQVHHIRPAREFPELAYDVNNLMSLCTECHAEIERKRG